MNLSLNQEQMANEVEMEMEMKVEIPELRPSEAISLALESKLGVNLTDDDGAWSITYAMRGYTNPKVSSFLAKFLPAAIEDCEMFNPKEWGNTYPSVTGATYAQYQINKAFFLMVLLEYLLDNPEEDTFADTDAAVGANAKEGDK